jgi:hypothetical protein
MAGPHAASYIKLAEHADHIQDSPHFTDHWREGVKTNMQSCLACHAGGNLYETVFAGLESENDESKYTRQNYPKLFSPPPPRSDEASRITGVDCLTCHVKDDKVITNASFRQSSATVEGQCNLLPSKFFSHPLNCNSCHGFTYKNTLKNVEEGLVSADAMNCLRCHQEYDASGKGTHYYYWKHDPPHKKRPPEMELFHCISISSKKEAGTSYVVFRWKNNNAPHGYPDCAEYIIELSLLSAEGDTIGIAAERINRKVDQGAAIKAVFQGEPPGVAGYCNYVESEPLHREYPIQGVADVSGMKALVTIKVKTQLWAADSEAKVMQTRSYDL